MGRVQEKIFEGNDPKIIDYANSEKKRFFGYLLEFSLYFFQLLYPD